MTGSWLDDYILFPSGAGIFLTTTISILALEPNQHHIQWILMALSPW
jgi:hypothetical protein